jgi:phage terminase Nu1 subunit (DNA packaging protein)
MLAVEQRIVDGLRSELLDVATTVRKAFDSLETNYVDQMDAKLARLDAMIKKLTADADIRTDLNALRESVKKLAGDGSVIDLPPLPSMRGAKLN